MAWERRIKVEEKKVETGADCEVMTLDEILQDKAYQSDFDKKVAKVLETAKTKWKQEVEVEKTEAEKLAKMDADEKQF